MVLSTITGAVGALAWNKTITLNNASIKALPSGSVNIVPAPGSGRFFMVIEAIIYADCSSGAYTNISDESFFSVGSSQYVFNRAGSSVTGMTDLIGATAKRAVFLSNYQSDFVATDNWGLVPQVYIQSGFDNVALDFNCSNSGGNFTGGNAANSLQVTVFYRVIQL